MVKLLPIGSVVLLKEGSKNVMIYGRKQIDMENSKVWDYLACLYPEGNINSDFNFLFNHEDIEEVVFTGYKNEEEDKLQEVLNNIEEEFLKNKTENEASEEDLSGNNNKEEV